MTKKLRWKRFSTVAPKLSGSTSVEKRSSLCLPVLRCSESNWPWRLLTRKSTRSSSSLPSWEAGRTRTRVARAGGGGGRLRLRDRSVDSPDAARGTREPFRKRRDGARRKYEEN